MVSCLFSGGPNILPGPFNDPLSKPQQKAGGARHDQPLEPWMKMFWKIPFVLWLQGPFQWDWEGDDFFGISPCFPWFLKKTPQQMTSIQNGWYLSWSCWTVCWKISWEKLTRHFKSISIQFVVLSKISKSHVRSQWKGGTFCEKSRVPGWIKPISTNLQQPKPATLTNQPNDPFSSNRKTN